MPESKELSTRNPRRPSWFEGSPSMEFDCRATGAGSTLQEILTTAKTFPRGQIFVVRSASEPALLCRILANRGFNHWPEDDGEGGSRVLFLKVAG
ncbi:MAG: hypothetical protein ACHQ2Z_07375 [Elusimicrobiota bacterium]